MLLLRASLLRLSWPCFLRSEASLPDKISSPKKGFGTLTHWRNSLQCIHTVPNTLNYLMGLSVKFKCSSMVTGGQPWSRSKVIPIRC